MRKIIVLLFLIPLFSVAQTQQLNFVHKDGEVIGRWKVMDLPTALFPASTHQGQLLIYYPLGKDPAHIGLGIWQPGKGETTSLDLTQMYTSSTGASLPGMINKGLSPYSVLLNGDTIWHALVCIHNDFQSSYRAQLSNIVPYILDKIGLQYNSAYTWASGLSEGGAGTWAVFCVDSLLSKRIHANVALATGGYDNFLTDQKLVTNLIAACKNGAMFLPYVGTQDPSYNPIGFLATDAFMKTHAPSNHYFPRVIINGTHSANVWDLPWKSRGFWDSLGNLLSIQTLPPPPNPLHARIWAENLVVGWPITSVRFVDSSTGSHNFITWGATAFPTGFPGRWYGGMTFGDILFANLMEGSYKIQLVIGDDYGHTDTAVANLRVYGPPKRVVMSIIAHLFGVPVNIPLDQADIIYNDDNP